MGVLNQQTGGMEAPYKITRVQFLPACTQDMAKSKDYALGCQLLPRTELRAIANADQTSYFVTGELQAAKDFVDKEDKVWDDFQKRQLKLPLKIMSQTISWKWMRIFPIILMILTNCLSMLPQTPLSSDQDTGKKEGLSTAAGCGYG